MSLNNFLTELQHIQNISELGITVVESQLEILDKIVHSSKSQFPTLKCVMYSYNYTLKMVKI